MGQAGAATSVTRAIGRLDAAHPEGYDRQPWLVALPLASSDS